MLHLDDASKRYIMDRVRKMLKDKSRLDEKYRRFNNFEEMYFKKLQESLTETQRDQLEEYRNAVIDREFTELYYAYLVGLRDGVRVQETVTEFEIKEEQ
ncbi:MAG: hypothetical protein E7414_04685 [Ruminococcaceae bacterium]|nr:hypothetical protein [Oscillospiraceae bacterium]